MTILPVLDLMTGLVVRGMRGRRSEYRPINSRLCGSPRPADVARAIVETFHFAEAYVADLDAITGGEPDWKSYEAIAATGLRLWIDAGVSSRSEARRLLDWNGESGALARLVVGLESLASLSSLAELLGECGNERLVFSLDMKQGRPLSAAPDFANLSPTNIAEAAIDCGFTSMILLDLAQVGSYEGTGTSELCRALGARYPHVQFIGGGGVRSIDDVRQLSEAGFARVLVASALHDGRIQPQELPA
jgi:phosphoribosylformimino-5-aminoimidazole carboxamide ribotide isomerase